MQQHKHPGFRNLCVGIIGLILVMLFSACAGVTSGTGGTGVTTNPNGSSMLTIIGSISAIDTSKGSVTLSVNNQSFTIGGLSAAQLAALQGQVGKMFTFQVTQNTDGTYTIGTGTNPTDDEGTPNVTPGVETPEPSPTAEATSAGSIDFIGKVQSASASSIVVSMPDGSNLTANIVSGTTSESDFSGAQPAVGQLIKVTVNANSDGSYTATKLGATDSGDVQNQNVVTYHGVTTGTVGSDNMLHFKVGSKSYSFTIGSGADLGDFNNSATSIQNNQSVKVEVTFTGTTGSVTKVSNGS